MKPPLFVEVRSQHLQKGRFGGEIDLPTWSIQLLDTGLRYSFPKSNEASSFGYQFYSPAPPEFTHPSGARQIAVQWS